MKTRVVIAEDSDVTAAFLERILEEGSDIQVVGRTASGLEVSTLAEREVAHVIIVDIFMPGKGGLGVIRELSARCPVIVVSCEARDSELAREAIAQGARAFFTKRELAHAEGARRLRAEVRALGRSLKHTARPVVLAAGSTGAVAALEKIVAELAGADVPVLVVQHLPAGREFDLARALSAMGMPARVAEEGDSLEPGVLLAPSELHMSIGPTSRIRLLDSPPVNGHRPSADVLFSSAAFLGNRAVAVVLSGLGKDGAAGIAAIAANGGRCYAMHPEDCAAPSMPRLALAASKKVRAVRMVDLPLALRGGLE